MSNVMSDKASLCCCGPCCPGKLCDNWTWNPTEDRWMGNLFCRIRDECGIFDGSGVLEPGYSMLSTLFWSGQMNDELQTRIELYCDVESGRVGWRQYHLLFYESLVNAMCGYTFPIPYPVRGSCSPLNLVFEAYWYDEHTDPEDRCAYTTCEVGKKLTVTISCEP